MICPFLRETRAIGCSAAPQRKPIIEQAAPGAARFCASPSFAACPVYRETGQATSSAAACPYLDEKPVHYCGAAAVPQYIPWTQGLGRCGSDCFRFCESWLALARPLPGHGVARVDGIPVPEDLWYSPNHLWLHVAESGACHVGIDGFLAHVLNRVDAISFVTPNGVHRPSAVITIRGIDWPLVFPNLLMITTPNVYARHAPSRIIEDPYGAGWLFEGWEVPPDERNHGVLPGLVSGHQAQAWIASEMSRLNSFVHSLPTSLANDGGTVAQGLVEHLSREETFSLFHQFFAPHTGWTGTR